MQPGDDSYDPAFVVVVPARPGPLRRVEQFDRDRDDVDAVLDDLFGEPDHRGPGIADAVLVGGGAGLAVIGPLASWPTAVTVIGVAAAALGLVLPVRSAWRRAGAYRRARKMAAVVADGTLLRTDDDLLRQVVAAHERIEHHAGQGSGGQRARSIAHAAVSEVATLLGGRLPATDAEREYVAARAVALDDVAAALVDTSRPPDDASRRQAMVEARQDVEAIAGASSVTDAAELVRDLREGRG